MRMITIIIAAMLGICFGLAYSLVKDKEEFMKDCLKERKQYECTAMWRAGDIHAVVIPTGTR